MSGAASTLRPSRRRELVEAHLWMGWLNGFNRSLGRLRFIAAAVHGALVRITLCPTAATKSRGSTRVDAYKAGGLRTNLPAFNADEPLPAPPLADEVSAHGRKLPHLDLNSIPSFPL